MADNFVKVIDHLIINENGPKSYRAPSNRFNIWGYSNDPNDSGGPTMHGFTFKAWVHFCNKYRYHDQLLHIRWENFHSQDNQGLNFFDIKKFKKSDFRDLKPSEVKFAYFKEYWEPSGAEELPSGIDYFIFDFWVNSGSFSRGSLYKGKNVGGRKRAAIVLQGAVGTHMDGAIGPVTIAAVHKYVETNGVKRLLKIMDADKRRIYRSFRSFFAHGDGWFERFNSVLEKCYELLDDVYIVDTKPLAKSKTIKAASTEAKIGVAALTVGGLAPAEDKAMQGISAIMDNLEAVSMVSSAVHNIYAYGWMIPAVVMVGFSGYYAYNRWGDWFEGKI